NTHCLISLKDESIKNYIEGKKTSIIVSEESLEKKRKHQKKFDDIRENIASLKVLTSVETFAVFQTNLIFPPIETSELFQVT
ncbi:13086_t:CDS:2, partial [Funneliformis geosporum]